MKSFLKFAGGALLGAAIGAGTALLLAPKKGDELREDIRHRYDDASQKVRAKAGKMRAKIEVKVDEARHDLADRRGRVVEAFQRLRPPKSQNLEVPAA